MFEVLVRFIVLGKIPGTDFEVGFRTSLVIAGFLMIVWVTMSVRKIIKTPTPKTQPTAAQLELITI